MVFGFFKRKPPPGPPEDPLAAFDTVIASLEREGAQVRKSAATLLAVRSELLRDQEKYEQRMAAVKAKLELASADAKAEKTLRKDLLDFQQRLDRTKEALAQSEANATLLKDAAEDLARQLGDLQEERQSARARLKAGLVVSEALKARVENFDRHMKLDRARDEIEKANALAELYREDHDKR